MKGYKGMDENMRCRGMQYKLSESTHIDGEIEICENGSHFCKNLLDVFCYYKPDGKNRFFEIEAFGTIVSKEGKSASSDMRIVRELTSVEVNRCKYGYGYGYGYGDGYGNGDGYGYGYGDGNGYGYGCGGGYGNGDGYGYGYGDGNGYGDGYGDGNGNGDGDGYDVYKIIKFI